MTEMKEILAIFGLVILLVSCKPEKQTDLTLANIPSFPYEEILASCDSTDYFPVIGDDGDGFNPIANHIEYLEDEHLGINRMYADSIQEAYNFTLAFNALAMILGPICDT